MSISARYRYTMGENMITRISSEQRYNILVIWLLSRYFPFFLNTFHARIKNFFQGPGGGGLRKLIKFAGDRGPGGGGVEAYFE